MQAKVDELATAIQDLQGAVERRLHQQTVERARMVDDLGRPTYARVVAAMKEATVLGGLANCSLIVRANTEPDGPRLRFAFGAEFRHGSRQSELELKVEFVDEGVEGTWLPDAEVDAVAVALADRIRAAGLHGTNHRIDWSLAMSHLQAGLRLALVPERVGWTPEGALIELDGDWAMTTAGLEHAGHGVVIRTSDFPPDPHPNSGFFTRVARDAGRTPPEAPEWEPERPQWAEPTEWQQALRRASAVVPPRHPYHDSLALPEWRPWDGRDDLV